MDEEIFVHAAFIPAALLALGFQTRRDNARHGAGFVIVRSIAGNADRAYRDTFRVLDDHATRRRHDTKL